MQYDLLFYVLFNCFFLPFFLSFLLSLLSFLPCFVYSIQYLSLPYGEESGDEEDGSNHYQTPTVDQNKVYNIQIKSHCLSHNNKLYIH